LEVEARVEPLINAIFAVLIPVFVALPEPVIPLPVAVLGQRPDSEAIFARVLSFPVILQSLGTTNCERVDLGFEGVFLGAESELAVGGGLHGVVPGLSQLAGLLHQNPIIFLVPELNGLREVPHDFAVVGPIVWVVQVALALAIEKLPLVPAIITAPALIHNEAFIRW
jgi:hypothetical protein